ncbi:hypothetical protein [Escherichia coli]|uniref:hypothetical protein n=1 Tax=Escherichia coli TaxID=562 RepID=UPI003DA74D19
MKRERGCSPYCYYDEHARLLERCEEQQLADAADAWVSRLHAPGNCRHWHRRYCVSCGAIRNAGIELAKEVGQRAVVFR